MTICDLISIHSYELVIGTQRSDHSIYPTHVHDSPQLSTLFGYIRTRDFTHICTYIYVFFMYVNISVLTIGSSEFISTLIVSKILQDVTEQFIKISLLSKDCGGCGACYALCVCFFLCPSTFKTPKKNYLKPVLVQ